MKLGDRLEEALAKGDDDDLVQQRYTFSYASWYLAVKALLSVGFGSFVLYTVASPRMSGVLVNRLIIGVTGVSLLVYPLIMLRGLRQITISGRDVKVMYGSGKSSTWALGALVCRNAARQMAWTGGATVRAVPDGHVAFRLPRDFPGWRRIIKLIGGPLATA